MRYFTDRITKLNLSYLLIHPAAIALYIWVLMFLLLPDFFSKYNIEIVKTDRLSEGRIIQFIDLNEDGITEEVVSGYNYGLDFPMIIAFENSSKVIDQWNMRGKLIRNYKTIPGNFDHDNYKELYAITIVNDSIFLNGIEMMESGGLEIKEKYIAKSGTFDGGQLDTKLESGKLIDTDKDGQDEVIFTLYGGFSKYPRTTFCYFIEKDSLVSSPLSAAGISSSLRFMDLNGDGVVEITGEVAAHENIHYPMPYTDSSAWLMVLDPAEGLDFLFPPVELDKGIGSTCAPEPIQLSGKKYIATILKNGSSPTFHDYSVLAIFDINGKLLNSRKLYMEEFSYVSIVPFDDEKNDKFYLIDAKGNIYSSDLNLNLKHISKLDYPINKIAANARKHLDIDGDGEKEILFLARSLHNHLLIYRSDLSDPVIVDLKDSYTTNIWNLSVVNSYANKKPLLCVQVDHKVYYFSYSRNILHAFTYPIYFGLYLVIFLLLWLLQKAQDKVAQRRYNTERLILKQQLAISKNQIEPHFMLNTLNNIGYLFMKEERAKAQYYFGKFASLINRNLQYADQVVTTLKEELKFIEDYLVLQQYRLGDEFRYEFIVDEALDTSAVKIPHSLLFTFAENAVKHGLLLKEGEKKLLITAYKLDERIRIEIIDNGIGRTQAAEKHTNGSGKGIEIVHNILNSYNKLFNSNISFEINDLENGNDKINGTAVYVLI